MRGRNNTAFNYRRSRCAQCYIAQRPASCRTRGRPLSILVGPMTEAKRPRGRPPTGEAKTATQRVNALDEALKASGGRILNRTRLSPEATAALAALSGHFGTDRAAIEAALIDLNKRCAQRKKRLY